jgi:putative colanic acid biosynthesis acetyltransferase WcaF
MEDFASIGEHAWIYSLDRIRIGRWSCVGQGVSLLTGTHDYSDPAFSLVTKPVTIGDGVWVAVGAKVLPGITLNDYCVIGAGSIVTKDMPEMMICAGNPCAPIKRRRIKSGGGWFQS